MAAGAPEASRDTTALLRFFARNPPPEAVDKNGVHQFGEPPTTPEAAEEYKRQRHLVTEPHDVLILDARKGPNGVGGLGAWKLDTHGFQVVRAPEPLADFTNNALVKREYYPRVLELVKGLTGARHVVMTNTGGGHLLRTENSSIVGAYARFCHCDAGPDSPDVLWREALARQGVPKEEAASCDICMYNFWHPFDRPAFKNPLCLLDASTVDYADKEGPPHKWGEIVQFKFFNKGTRGVEAGSGSATKKSDLSQAALEVRERARRGEGVAALGMGPLYTPKQRWVFYPDMPTDESWVFKQYDTRQGVARASFHNSFYDPFHDSDPNTPGRRSFECRVLAAFPKEKKDQKPRL